MTLDEVIDQLERQDETVVLWLLPIALEVKEQRQEIAKLRVLLEHEETVRSKKLHRETPVKSQSFLRGSTLHKGDRVMVEGRTGTVENVDGTRVNVVHDQMSNVVGRVRWYKASQVKRAVASVA
jgi:hypothetical protein